MYISQDPIGLQGGDRFYGYVKDPNTWIDPLGLASKTYGKDDLNVDTGTARAIMDGSSHDIDSSIKDKNLIMTQTAVDELNAYGERSNRKQEVQNFLDSNNVNIVPDNPSDRAKNLPTTRKIGDNDKIIFGTGDSMGITTITSDAKFVSASSAHGVDFDVIVHSPVSTTK